MVHAAIVPTASVRDSAGSVRLRRANVNVTLVDEMSPASAPASG